MKIKINLWSFIFSFVCIAFFFIAISSGEVVNFATDFLHIHPLSIVLVMSSATFLFGLVGFAGATNWKLLIKSVLTISITFGLIILILCILVMGNLFKFT